MYCLWNRLKPQSPATPLHAAARSRTENSPAFLHQCTETDSTHRRTRLRVDRRVRFVYLERSVTSARTSSKPRISICVRKAMPKR
ncbi:hypothetical protein THAOC_33505 [Thalassiosira oceanica]|uniref:Uncharacterized protein n=1 Tax=Thalassiosira oceanica TaxID=159749 RepID=K0RFQ1_THAOC|nr:hypothetical protein THAOC_33505 [Thalassiosira oceanica]|eukprot:EJK47756.1 hypothetical protein THAOC_33505 [Thalassiosira oceanica]